MQRICLAAVLGLLTSSASAAEKQPQSGLTVGDLPVPFQVKDVTGPNAGKHLCYYCNYGSRPVVSVFTRSLDPSVQQLVKQLDELVARHQKQRLAAFVVLLSDDPASEEPRLRSVARRQKLQYVPLTVFEGAGGPATYRVSKEVSVTVMMWNDSDVTSNHVSAGGKLDAALIARILKSTQQMLD